MLFAVWIGCASAYAQQLTVTGKVIDAEGLEVIGGTVRVKGKAAVGTITDIDGKYSLQVGPKDVLVFSYIGYVTQEIPVKGRKVIDVQLKQDNKVLEEVVVVGYGSMQRKDLTGSVVSVRSDELMKTPGLYQELNKAQFG